MTNESIVGRRRLGQVLRNEDGIWTCIILLGGVASPAGVPLVSVILEVLQKIRDVERSVSAISNDAKILGASVDSCRAIIVEFSSRDMRSRDMQHIEGLMTDFKNILDEIQTRVQKWLDKNFIKKMWSSRKYAREFQLHAASIVNWKDQLLMLSTQALLQEHQRQLRRQTLSSLVAFASLGLRAMAVLHGWHYI